jgi:hypothetical protein
LGGGGKRALSSTLDRAFPESPGSFGSPPSGQGAHSPPDPDDSGTTSLASLQSDSKSLRWHPASSLHVGCSTRIEMPLAGDHRPNLGSPRQLDFIEARRPGARLKPRV